MTLSHDEVPPSELVARIAARRDREAFRTLFLHFAPRVKSYLIRQGARPEKAEELAQETLLTLWRKADYFDPARVNVSAWIFTIARNLRIDALRRERSAVAYALAIGAEPETDGTTPETEEDFNRRASRLRQAMAGLPSDQMQVVQLSFFQDKPHAEIARELSLPLGTVKSRLRLALARLRGVVGDLS